MLKPSIKLLKLSMLAFACSASSGVIAADMQYKDQQNLHDIAGSVSAERIGSDIQTLVDFGTRHTL